MRRKLVLIVPPAVLALTGSAVAGTWLWASTAFEESWRSWLAERRTAGYTFTNARPALGGFPGKLVARFDDPGVKAPAGWRWRLPDVTARAPVTQPLTVRWRAPGTHTFTTAAGETLRLTSDTATGRLAVTAGGRVEHGRIRLGGAVFKGLPAGPVEAKSVSARAGPRPEAAAERLPLRLHAERVTLPPSLRVPLGSTVKRVHLEATARGPLPRELTREALAAWREAGGALEVHTLAVDWASVSIEGDGQLTLDKHLRPAGTLDLTVRGLDAAIRALLDAGVVSERVAGYARMAAAALDQVDGNSGGKAITFPLRFREGKAYVGPVALWRLSPVLADRTTRPDAPR